MTIRPDEPLSFETSAVREAAPGASGEPGVVPPVEWDADPVEQPDARRRDDLATDETTGGRS